MRFCGRFMTAKSWLVNARFRDTDNFSHSPAERRAIVQNTTQISRRRPPAIAAAPDGISYATQTYCVAVIPSRRAAPRANAVGDAPWAGVVDPHRDRTAVLRIGDRQHRADRPRARGGSVAVGIETLAAGGTFAG